MINLEVAVITKPILRSGLGRTNSGLNLEILFNETYNTAIEANVRILQGTLIN